MEVYLDNSATTKAFDEVGDLVRKVMCEDYGNPSSLHRKGMEAEQYVRSARETFAKILKVQEKEIFFTSGGTESDNLALIGTARAYKRRGNHLITTAIEHPAILNTMRYLEDEEGFRVTYLPVDQYGRVKLSALREALCKETILVSIMYVNNEVGSVQPVKEAGGIVKAYNREIIFHSDAVQGFGKYRIFPKREGIDLLTVSSHKIHGPKGMGALYISDKVKIRPIVFGGEQQKNIRSGTENVPGIVGMGVAAEEAYTGFEEKVGHLYALKDHMLERLSEVEGAYPNSYPGKESAPQVVSVSFSGVRSEVLLHALEDKGIYVSSGSACSSNHPDVSGTLKGIGVKQELLDSTLRFSFGRFNTIEEVDYCIETLKELLPVLRRYQRG